MKPHPTDLASVRASNLPHLLLALIVAMNAVAANQIETGKK